MSMILLDTGPSPKGWHRLEKFMTCPRKFALSRAATAAGERSPESEATVLGSLCHIGAAHHYARKGAALPGGVVVNGETVSDPAMLYTPEEALEIVAATKKGIWMDCLDKAQMVVRAYREFWSNERVRPLMVETVLWFRPFPDPLNPDAPLGQGRYDQSGRIDMCGMYDHSVYILDHKTTSRVTNQASYYARSGQFLLYRHMGFKVFGEAFKGVVLNLLDIGKPEPRFSRPQLPPIPGRFRRFPHDIAYAEDRLRSLEEQNLPPEFWPAHPSEHTCQTRYAECPVAEKCDWGSVGM